MMSTSIISETTRPWHTRWPGCEVPESPQKSSCGFILARCPSPSPFPAPSAVGLVAGDRPKQVTPRKPRGVVLGADPAQLPWQQCRAPSRWPWASTSRSGGNISSGFTWAWARLQRAICWVFTIHHLPCHHLPGADRAGQPYKYNRGCRYRCSAGARTCQRAVLVPRGWGGTAGWWLSGRAAHGFAPQAHAAALAGAGLPEVPPHGQGGAGGIAAPTAPLPTCAGSLAASLGQCFSETNSRSSQPC